jgi:hypothetical protein
MLFQLMGNKTLILSLIKYPLCKADNPARYVLDFVNEWTKHKETKEYKEAKEQSKQKNFEYHWHVRLSKHNHYVVSGLRYARKLQEDIADGYCQVTRRQENLLRQLQDGDLDRRLEALLDEKQKQPPKYCGAVRDTEVYSLKCIASVF